MCDIHVTIDFEITEHDKNVFATLREHLEEDKREILDKISTYLSAKGESEDVALFVPYWIFVLGMKYSQENNVQVKIKDGIILN